jgi:hypothetical protein
MAAAGAGMAPALRSWPPLVHGWRWRCTDGRRWCGNGADAALMAAVDFLFESVVPTPDLGRFVERFRIIS